MRRPADFRVQIARYRRNTPLVVGLLALLLLVLTVIYFLVQRGRNLPETLVTNQVLLFFLRNVNLLLILGIFFVLARDLFKLWVERRQRRPGSRLRTRLVASFVGLALVPVLVLFFYAVEMLQGSVERWFSPSLRVLLEQAGQVAEAALRQVEGRCRRDATAVALELSGLDLRDPANRSLIDGKLRERRAALELDLLGVYEESEFVAAVADPQRGLTDLPEPGRSLLREAADKGEAVRIVEIASGAGRLVLGAARGRVEAGRPRTLVVAGTLVEPALARPSEELIEAYQTYRQLEVQKGQFKASYLLLFLLVTLLILLASTWMGVYLARRIMVPIQALAEGTRRISSGDLERQVETPADDEIGVLVESFNRMTAELRRSREVIERSNRELREANRRLDEERALVAAVLESVAAGVVSVDREGRILTCNRAALAMLRQRREELGGRPLGEAWADPERARLARLLEEPEAAPADSRELRLVLGGEWRTFEVKVNELRDPAGAVNGRVVVIEDLTELQRAQQLAAWSEAARRLAHEIKNPLTPIRLAAERVLAKYRQGDADLGQALESGAETIVASVARMQSLVDEFSRYARMPRPQPRAIEPASLVEEVVALYRDLKPGVVLVTRLPSDLGTLWADPDQLRRVLINLLDNAFEATAAPGEIEVELHGTAERVEIAVRDNGRGIPEAQREKLFLPFFSTKGRGTGLGLAIVHRIVADHHGSVRVEDNAPHGTVFVVDLPRE